ncbi:MAG: HemK/PrmC family methyltransferase, partial [Dehalococcoidia bacterium]
MTLQEALRHGTHLLAQAGSDEANLEAELLLAHTLDIDRVHLYQRLRDPLLPAPEQAYGSLLERRLAHEPTAYLMGHKEFYGLDFEVAPAALIPRPDTEVLVGLVTAFARERFPNEPFVLIDVGVGCGAIAVAVAHELPQAQVMATDVSPEALTLAQRNVHRHGLDQRIRLLSG